MPTGRMVRLVTVGDPIEARIIAARLGSEGLVWELRGGAGPYPVGPVHVYVDEADLAEAETLMALAGEPGDEPAGRAPVGLWVVLVAIVAVALFGIGRVAFGSGVAPSPPPTAPAGP